MKDDRKRNKPVRFHLAETGDRAQQMADGIIREIECGYWRSGDILPTLAEFSAALHIGGHAPRTAMKRLSEAGIVQIKKHVGAIVTGKGTHKWKGRIAFITTSTWTGFYKNALAFTLQSLFESAGWEFVHVPIHELQEDDKKPDLSPLERHLAHGIDLAICHTGSRQVAASLDAAGVRYVFAGGSGREFPNAITDFETDPKNAVGQLARNWSAAKVRNALIVDFEHVMERTITSTLFSSGIKFQQIMVKRPTVGNYLKIIQQAGLDAVAKFFAVERNRANPPDSIFFYDDYLANGGLIALAATGLRVPEDIRVATLANKGFGPVWFKPLTRLEYDPVGNAKLIGDYVLKLLAGKKATPPTLQLKFIEGKT